MTALDTQPPRVVNVHVVPSSSKRVHIVLHLAVTPGTSADVARLLARALDPATVNAAIDAARGAR